MKYLTDELIKPDGTNYHFINQIGMMPEPQKFLSRYRNPYQKIRDLKNDPHVWSCIQSRKSGTLTLDSFIDSNNADTQVLEFVNQLIEELDINKFIAEILEAPLMGFQPHEILWQYDNNLIKPVEIIARPNEYFAFDIDGILKYRNPHNLDLIKLPEFKFILTFFEANQITPLGNSLLSKCYWNVIFKNTTQKFWVNYIEKYGFPLLIGQYQRGATQQETQKLAEALSEMTNDTVIVTPMDINIEIKEPSRNSSAELYRELINYCNNEISKTILSETLTTEMQSGSYAAAQTHFRVRREVIISDSRIAEKSVNKLIEYAVKINFDGSKIPKFRFVINDADNLNKIDRDTKLVNSGIKFTKEYWMKTYGLSGEDFDL